MGSETEYAVYWFTVIVVTMALYQVLSGGRRGE